jgi:oxygen-independent coproporphyrinogen-3 oxidase
VPIGDHKTENGGTGDTLELGAVGESSERGDSTHEGRREQGFRKMNDRYIDAVVAELKQIAAQNTNKEKKIRKVPLRSIYFGGGTPSLAPIESIEKILKHAIYNADAPFQLLQQPQSSHEDTDKVTNTNDLMVKTEITMEMDPGTFDREYLSSLRDLGINRVSLGVQSFDDDLLRAMGRTHRRADVLQAVRDIAFVFGGNEHENNRWENVNYSIDLISGCPGLTPAKWVETLQEATVGVKTRKSTSTNTPVDSAIPTMKEKQSYLLSSLPPPKHISVYDLQIEEGTVFGKWAAKAKEDAAAKRKEGKPSNTTYHDGEDEDPARDFTVALPLGGSSETSGLLTQSLNPNQKPNQQQQRLLHLPSEDECAFMYKYAAGYLRAKKYEHYEVSSYAAFNEPVSAKRKKVDDGNCIKEHTSPTSKRSVHNQIYWEYDGQWYAVGLGATSFVDKELVARPRGMHDYIEWVHEENAPSSSTTKQEDGEEEEEGTCEDLLSDLLLKRLRTIDGLDLNWLETNYGSDIVKEVLRGAQLGLDLELAEHTDDNFLQLADPHG